MYKLITGAKTTYDFSIGFDRDRNRKQRELTENKNQTGKYHLRITLKDFLGLQNIKKKLQTSYGLGYKLTLTSCSDNTVLKKPMETNVTKTKINSTKWYVPLYTKSIPQQAILSQQILSKLPTIIQYVERSLFTEKVKSQNLWGFELRTQEGINVFIRIFIGFQRRDRQGSQLYFYRPPLKSTIGTKKSLDYDTLLNYDDDG